MKSLQNTFYNIVFSKKSSDHNENMILNNNEHLMFQKIMNQCKIYSKLLNNYK
jgi:hypothetical protein